ncbi:MAG: hypothetical protein OZSIB_0274 [Candidatus Ozemobacter sibiricus]|jgi:hypothetical protein|uniref:Uncharacterized protein n=1 Tax=Candidatus Ozemobacter sibiricus TaxID=2268124 RepID=A0A367ZM90_9BACT|nr:MAG: hypothetical protein OZSIB_0274 [Candidatus Ozemobacter sibiricus]
MIALALDEPPVQESEGPGWFDEVLEPWLRPLQVGLALACLVMVVFLGTLPREVPISPHSARGRLVAQTPTPPPPATVVAAQPSAERPVNISPAEVAAFMKRLEEYRRLHPEMELPRRAVPSFETVGYRGP